LGDLDRAEALSWTPDVAALSRSLKAAPEVPAPAANSNRFGSDEFSVLTHIPFTRSEILEPAESPYVVHGKLFLEYRNGLGQCSGTVVTSNNSSVIVTAAHCLVDATNGTTPERVQFAPGYRLEYAPFGVWNATAFGVTRQWADSVEDGGADPRYDVGAVVLEPNEDGQAVEDVVGSREISFNQQPRRLFDSFGYPAVLPFDGERLWVCESEKSDLLDLFPSPQPHGIGCDMTPGSSGGGWVLPNGNLNSVNSFKLLDHPDIMYGPQFGTSAQKLYNVASDYDGTVTTHKMNLSIKLSGHLVVSGRMKADDGFALCARGAPVKIFRRKTPASNKSARWRMVDRTETNGHGKFRAKLPDKRGRYHVESPSGVADLSNECSAAKSDRRAHRH
jgi:V8-like Glu-specific endopeptidase